MIVTLKKIYDSVLLRKYRIQKIWGMRKEKYKYRNHSINSPEKGNNKIKEYILQSSPSAIAKIGLTELKCLQIYNYRNTEENWLTMKKTGGRYFGGIFPDNKTSFNDFSEIYSHSLSSLNLLAVLYNTGEADMINKYASSAQLINGMSFIEPFYFSQPWSAALEGKTVLVVHPFESSIKHQYTNRKKLWENDSVLPDFKLKTLKVPQNAGVEKPKYPDWKSTLAHLSEKISEIDFDVALIGAGAWSIPLAVVARKAGKIGIHLGGGLQILFGIKGRRWDDHKIISSFYNRYWINILDEDKPNMEHVQKIPWIDRYW